MSTTETNKRKWLVAAWPGMGQVGSIAAGYLVHALGAKPVQELPARGFFDIEQVEVKAGVVVPPHLPRNVLHRWQSAEGGPDLLIFVAEAQPTIDNHEFAHELLDRASQLGANGVISFASVASQLHPSKAPKAFGVVTQPDMKADIERAGAQMLQDGQIGGLNGVLLGAAAERGLPGICLLGEIPYFAGAVANPKAARVVLGAFSKLTGVPVDTTELSKHDEKVDQVLLDLLERLKQQAEQTGSEIALPEDPEQADEFAGESGDSVEPDVIEAKPDFATRERIEKLFQEARADRSRAVQLKTELDSLGVFGQYEDRFLDLFKRAA
jgi:proteasome assembly chaperone (PAC2) family protein